MDDNFVEEKKIQEKIHKAVDEFQSFIFNAGAGSGKTYALIETLKHILKTKSNQLGKRRQRIICITYTNVAANEIKQRLGETDLIKVSTIHELLWEQISPYKSLQLVDIHKTKLVEEVKALEEKIEEKRKDICFDEPDFNILLTDEAKEFFYELEAKNLGAAEFRDTYMGHFSDKCPFLVDAMRNVADFKSFLKQYFKLERYKSAIEIIYDAKEKGKKISIEYDASVNNDRLASMRFSHDTLLEYSLEMFKRHSILRTIFQDKYPYLFIDEYQDTHPNVIEICQLIFNESRADNSSWLVGYFGDHRQNIYDDGIGEKLLRSPELTKIKKSFNRRSSEKVIELINRIRDEKDFQQQSIHIENDKGEVRFYTKNELLGEDNIVEEQKIVDIVLEEFKKEHGDDEHIHCLVTLNKTIAQLSGFENIYENCEFIYWENKTMQLLSHDLNKLHPAILAVYKVLNLYAILNNSKSTFNDLFGGQVPEVTASAAFDFYETLKSNLPNSTESLEALIANLCESLKTVQNLSLCVNTLVKNYFGEIGKDNAPISYELFISYLKRLIDSEKYDLDKVLNISIDEWIRWFDYINQEKSQIVYHTLHGTKGEEYDNVIVILGNHFGRKQREKFKKYFKFLGDDSLDKGEEPKGFENTRNLLYVAFSRAIKNLWIIYTDPIDDIKAGIDKVFEPYRSIEYE